MTLHVAVTHAIDAERVLSLRRRHDEDGLYDITFVDSEGREQTGVLSHSEGRALENARRPKEVVAHVG